MNSMLYDYKIKRKTEKTKIIIIKKKPKSDDGGTKVEETLT